MEMAQLLSDTIDIERERRKLENDGNGWEKIQRTLNDKYRQHSKKGVFVCMCCQKPVDLVLVSDRVCFFRHKDLETCAGSENHKRHTASRGVENEKKHHLGKSLLREYLAGNLKIHGVDVKFGYFYKKKLDMVPDLILQFEDETIWAIDYITGPKTDLNYSKIIQKRIQAYNEEGFRSFFLIDQDWYSPHPSMSAASLYKAETQVLRSTEYDERWKEKIDVCVRKYGEKSLIRLQPDTTLNPINVLTIAYIDILKSEASIVRLVPILTTYRKSYLYSEWAYMPHETMKQPLEQILSLNDRKTDFKWFLPNENVMRDEFEKIIEQNYKKFSIEEDIEKELKRKLQEEQTNTSNKQSQYNTTNFNHGYQSFNNTPPINMNDIDSEKITLDSNFNQMIEYYQNRVAQFRSAERLESYPVLNDNINRCENIIKECVARGKCDNDSMDRLYSLFTNLRNALHV